MVTAAGFIRKDDGLLLGRHIIPVFHMDINSYPLLQCFVWYKSFIIYIADDELSH